MILNFSFTWERERSQGVREGYRRPLQAVEDMLTQGVSPLPLDVVTRSTLTPEGAALSAPSAARRVRGWGGSAPTRFRFAE